MQARLNMAIHPESFYWLADKEKKKCWWYVKPKRWEHGRIGIPNLQKWFLHIISAIVIGGPPAGCGLPLSWSVLIISIKEFSNECKLKASKGRFRSCKQKKRAEGEELDDHDHEHIFILKKWFNCHFYSSHLFWI